MKGSFRLLSIIIAVAALTPGIVAQRKATPLSTSDWEGIRNAFERNRHNVFQAGDEYRARNWAQQWLLHFDQRGFVVKPDEGSWRWGLELQGYGFSGNEQVVSGRSLLTADKERVRCMRDSVVEEWYVNERHGLEHGFTFHTRPPGTGDRLSLRLALRGGLIPAVQSDGRAVRFLDSEGRAIVNYAKLSAWDADGKPLQARMTTTGSDLRLHVDEHGAHYPITIDPTAQQAYLKGSNTGAEDFFGSTVAVSGDTAVVGAPLENSAATGVNGDQSDTSAPDAGAAYVFVRSGGTWSQQAYLKASNTESRDGFGGAVAISGDTVVVGAVGEASNSAGVNGNQTDNSLMYAGAAYVFVRSGGAWSQQAYLKASNPGWQDLFGGSVAISGNTLVVGSAFEDSNARGVNGVQYNENADASGAAYVFVRRGDVWSQQAYLKASNSDADDRFARAVGISGDTVVIGASNEDSNAKGINGNQNRNTSFNSGAAYVFARSGNTWKQAAYLKASNTDAEDGFGNSVAISGLTIVIGAPGEASKATGINGQQADNSAPGAGAAYAFVKNGTTWKQQAYLKASNAASYDLFGGAVAISGGTIIAGAEGEASKAAGVDGDQNDNSVYFAGAAYVFGRTGSVWRQQAYLKASNPGMSDCFGSSVAVSDDIAVVGAHLEDSNAKGIDGNQSDESAMNAGAAYAFSIAASPPCVFTPSVVTKPNVLAPADQRMVEVTADLRVNACIHNEKVKLISVRSSDPGKSLFPGDIPVDIQGANFQTDDRKFLLRAEAKPGLSKKPRRTYTATFQVTDSTGRIRIVTGKVTVP